MGCTETMSAVVGSRERLAGWQSTVFGWRDIGFAEIPLARLATDGTPFKKWVPVGMPRIPEEILTCTFYLYATREDAARGGPVGGTGFLVLYPTFPHDQRAPTFYGVTNWHVAVKGGCSVVRANSIKGPPVIFEFGPEDWLFQEDGDDLAVIELPIDPAIHAIRAIPSNLIATPDRMRHDHINVGEDVFMIGRFIDHDGGPSNRPAARFGNISIMPAPIQQPNGRVRECFCIDMHSRSGHSGGPVFAYRTLGQDLAGSGQERLRTEIFGDNLRVEYRPVFVLLGVHCGQFPEPWEIKRQNVTVESEYVEGFSGMTMAIPAWSIPGLLDHPQFVERQKAAWEKLADQFPTLRHPPKPEAT